MNDFNNLFGKFKVFIYDLDDTIYPELDYLKKAYNFVSKKIIEKEKLSTSIGDSIYDFLINTFLREGRYNIFQKLISNFAINKFSLSDFLHCLRNVSIEENSIKMYPQVFSQFQLLLPENKIFIITNGNEIQQKNKFKSINIPFKDQIQIIYASSKNTELQKPNPHYIYKIIETNDLKKEDIVFLGDSEIDRETANSAGIKFYFINELKQENND